MIAARRVVKVTNVVVSANSKKDNLKEDDEEILTRYLKRPAETCVLIFIADELDKRRKISKLLLENCVAVEFGEVGQEILIERFERLGRARRPRPRQQRERRREREHEPRIEHRQPLGRPSSNHE